MFTELQLILISKINILTTLDFKWKSRRVACDYNMHCVVCSYKLLTIILRWFFVPPWTGESLVVIIVIIISSRSCNIFIYVKVLGCRVKFYSIILSGANFNFLKMHKIINMNKSVFTVILLRWLIYFKLITSCIYHISSTIVYTEFQVSQIKNPVRFQLGWKPSAVAERYVENSLQN